MKKITLILAIIGLPVFVAQVTGQTKVIYTLAGNGWSGYKGDGGPANNAELYDPQNQVFDAAGNLYIIDSQNNCIRMVNTGGIISTFAGIGTQGFSGDGGQASAAQFKAPTGIAIDASGNIYVADNANNRIRMINTSGIISTIAGNGSKGYGGDGGPATAAKLNAPEAVAADPIGNIYIADYYNNRIRKVNISGTISTAAGTGTGGFSGDGGAATAAKINGPTFVYVDASGNVFFTDGGNNRVREINTSGIISTVAGNGVANFSGDGGPATDASLNNPSGITMDQSGNMYISDQSNQRVRMVNTGGTISTFAGMGTFGYSGDGGPATDAELFDPCGLTVDASGNLYIADQQNDAVREVKTVLGVNTITLNGGDVSLYPNPASSTLNLNFTNTKPYNAQVEILDATGKQVIKDSAMVTAGKSLPVDVSGLSHGIYFVRISNGTQAKVLKFVKQ